MFPYRSTTKRFGLAFSSLAFLFLLGVTNAVSADEEELALRLSKLERALNNQGLLDLFQRLEALQSEVQTLRGQVEEQQYTIERLRESQRNAYVDLDRRLQESLNFQAGGQAGVTGAENPPLSVYQPGVQPEVAGTPSPGIDVRVEQAPSVDPRFRPQVGESPTAEAPLNPDAQAAPVLQAAVPENGGTSPSFGDGDQGLVQDPTRVPPQNPDQAYREAFGLLKAGKYDESIESFNLFLLDYPNSEYADNSQYWLGETYFVKQDYPSAIEQYQKLLTDYPNSKKQSHALLKIGYSFQRLGETDKATAVLQDLQTRYPGTTAARLAAERVQQIAAEAN